MNDLIKLRVAIMPAHVLYPLPNRMRDLTAPGDIALFIDPDESFVVHHWSCSWQSESSVNATSRILDSAQLQSQAKSHYSKVFAILKQQVLEVDDLETVWSTISKFL